MKGLQLNYVYKMGVRGKGDRVRRLSRGRRKERKSEVAGRVRLVDTIDLYYVGFSKALLNNK